MTLSAAEAHALYSRAWKVAPETRPTLFSGAFGEHLAETSLPEVFAALCRVACEDYIGSHAVRYEGDSVVVCTERYEGWPDFYGEGPTIHHAIVAAVEAVAAAKVVRA